MPHICYYVTGHGLGHASRAQAVAQVLLEDEHWSIEFRTPAPRCSFNWLLDERCKLNRVTLEPGVIQRDPFMHDPLATLTEWSKVLSGLDVFTSTEAQHLRREKCDLVISDCSPLACAAAKRAALPCLVIGNFTWDWILGEYLPEHPPFQEVIAKIRRLYQSADLYLRLPMSHENTCFRQEISCDFIARRHHLAPARVRSVLGLQESDTMVLLSFGGHNFSQLNLGRIHDIPGLFSVWDDPRSQPPGLLSAANRGLLYTDLIRAADVILTKPGFSIIAECIAQRTPVAYSPRTGFRENILIEDYLRRVNWPCLPLTIDALLDGSWIQSVAAFIRTPHVFGTISTQGAEQAAEIIHRYV